MTSARVDFLHCPCFLLHFGKNVTKAARSLWEWEICALDIKFSLKILPTLQPETERFGPLNHLYILRLSCLQISFYQALQCENYRLNLKLSPKKQRLNNKAILRGTENTGTSTWKKLFLLAFFRRACEITTRTWLLSARDSVSKMIKWHHLKTLYKKNLSLRNLTEHFISVKASENKVAFTIFTFT